MEMSNIAFLFTVSPFFTLPGLFLWAANSLVNFVQTVGAKLTSLAEKSFHKGMSESFQYSVEQTTRGNLWCFQNSNVWQKEKLGKFFVVLISFNTLSALLQLSLDIIFHCQLERPSSTADFILNFCYALNNTVLFFHPASIFNYYWKM